MKSQCPTCTLFLYCLLGLVAAIITNGEARDPPDILNSSPVTIPVRETLTLICHGDDPIHWTNSHVPEFDGRFQFVNSEGNSNSTSRRYATELILTNVNHNDVGFFNCQYNSTRDDDDKEASVYVYVDDWENTLVNLNPAIEFLPAIHGQDIVIPCRPTSPLVQMEIKKDYHNDIDMDSSDYDPRYGLLISSVAPISAGDYICSGRRGNVIQAKSWVLQVSANSGVSLKTPRINVTDDGAIQIGSDFTLDCVADEEIFVYYSINWTHPVSAINSGRASIQITKLKEIGGHPIQNMRKVFNAQLTISDARKEDAGEYICSVWNPNSARNASKFVNIYEKSERFLTVTTSANAITQSRTHDAQWVININSFPTKIDYVWMNQQGKEIGRDETQRFRIEKRSPGVVVLKILSTTWEDFGSYKFIVTVPDFKELYKTLNLHLTVQGKPELSIVPKQPETYFEYGKNIPMTCIARGYPKSNITWYFLRTQTFDDQLPRNCGGRGMDLIQSESSFSENELITRSTITYTPSKHGILRCKAQNSEGISCQQKLVKIIDFPGGKEFGIFAPEEYIDQDSVQLTCAFSKLNVTNSIEWKMKNGRGELISLSESSGIELKTTETTWSWRKVVSFPKINKTHAGVYVCLVGGGANLWNESLLIQVKDMIPPKIFETNLNQSQASYKEGEPPELRLNCKATGAPKPAIEWTKDGLTPDNWPNDIKYNITENGEALIFSYIRSAASGKYACTARNRNGTDIVSLDIEVEGSGIPQEAIAVIVIAVLTIIVLLLCLAKNSHKKRVQERNIRKIWEGEFNDGAVENINPELGIEDQANLLPYNRKWEFPRNQLHLGMQLGSGAFGRVMKAEAYNIIHGEERSTVAVKMVKANADESHIKALMSELKIMVHLGRHVNVVNLIGACTVNLIKKKELLVIVEFCKYGSLLNYMHRHRHTFINQLDPVRGAIDSTICRQISRSSQQSEAPRLNYASLTFTDTGNTRTASNGYRTLEELNEEGPVSPMQSPVFDNVFVPNDLLHGTNGRVPQSQSTSTEYYGRESHIGSMCTDMSYVSNSPTACGTDGKRRSSEASEWADTHYRGDYQHVEVRPIRSVDLLGWAFQMSRGMEYLASRKVLHGDLAARNVLLAENNVVKICDFGLAKEMYKNYEYKKKSEGVLLPVKWMATESIFYGVFSTQSDVWSFGVVLWELFTLGKTPYPGMEADDRFYKMLNEGYRMEKPPLSPSSIYDIMLECWANEASERPSFSTLVDKIGDLMDEGHRQEYVDLNVPYDRLNKEWITDGEDYLSKMSAPTFHSANNRPSPERQYENVNPTQNSGYLVPISPAAAQLNMTEYQNIIHRGEPHGHLLANNTGYVFMSHAPADEATNGPQSSIENITSEESTHHIPTETSGSSHSEGTSNSPLSPEYTCPSSEQESSGISNINYIPNHLFIGPGKSGNLNQIVEQYEKQQDNKIPKHNNAIKHREFEGDGFSNGRRPRHIRRHKNDSGVGSIDSTHEFRNPVNVSRPGSDCSEPEKPVKGEYGCQHNMSYVSHAPFEIESENQKSNANGGLLTSHPSQISSICNSLIV